MAKNLRNVLYAKGIDIKVYAKIIGVTEKTARNKLEGLTDFTYPEIKATSGILPEYRISFLFEDA